MAKAPLSKSINSWIRLYQKLFSRNHDVAKKPEHRLLRRKAIPKLSAEIGDREKRDCALSKLLHNLYAAGNRARYRLVKTAGIGIQNIAILREQSFAFGDHIRKHAALIMLKMPLFGHHLAQHEIAFFRVADDLLN